MSRIFISYRRDDARADARGLRDRLASVFGAKNIFMDVDNLLVGQRFDQELEKALEQCDVFLAVMGTRWTELLAERVASGERDYVRDEIAAALKRGAIVIPVLVDGAAIPQADDLPEELRDLALYQAHAMTHERFGRDVDDLIDGIKASRKARGQGDGRSRLGMAMGVVLLLGISAAFGTYFYYKAVTPISVERELEKAEAARKAEEKRKAEEAAVSKRELYEMRRAEAARKYAETQKAEEAAARERAEYLRPGRTFRDCPDCPEMVVIPAGSFMMGSPKSEKYHKRDEEGPGGKPLAVTIGKSFAVGKFEITNAQYVAFLNSIKRRGPEGKP